MKKGFTLIELLAVIVILAIIAFIATPIVLNLIGDSKAKSNETSAKNIIRAADIYYADEMMKGNENEFPKTFTFPTTELKFEGNQPDSGRLIIYDDGTIFSDFTINGEKYIKLPNKTEFEDKNVQISSSLVWETNGEGVLTKYYLEYVRNAAHMTNLFIELLNIPYEYATHSGDFDYTKSLSYNINSTDLYYIVEACKNNLPVVLNKEFDKVVSLIGTNSNMTEEDLYSLIQSNSKDLPNIADIADPSKPERELTEYKIYDVIFNTKASTDTLVIPSYILHEDGSLEKITHIAYSSFRVTSGNINDIVKAFYCYMSPLNPLDESEDLKEFNEERLKYVMNLVIPDGIIAIEDFTFSFCYFNKVTLPDSLQYIGESAFPGNRISTIKLPKELKIIGAGAFAYTGLQGNITIPSSVEEIGESAFATIDPNAEIEDDPSSAFLIGLKLNNITSVTFEPHSQLQTIGAKAFEFNNITKIEIPYSIKNIESRAFADNKLTSVVIKRAQGDDLIVAEDAFGDLTPVYQP